MCRMFHLCLKNSSWVFQGCFEGVIMVFQECFKCVSKLFQARFKFQGCLKIVFVLPPPVSHRLKNSFKAVSKVFPGNFVL